MTPTSFFVTAQPPDPLGRAAAPVGASRGLAATGAGVCTKTLLFLWLTPSKTGNTIVVAVAENTSFEEKKERRCPPKTKLQRRWFL